MSDPLESLYQTFNTGDPREKYDDLPTFPRMLDLEMTNVCNFRCIFCPTGNQSMNRRTGMMNKDTFGKILAQCNKNTAFRFIGWGEPTLNPNLPGFIEQATERGIITHLNTNGNILNPILMQQLISAGLTSIKFSFQGVDAASYETMRGVDCFEMLIGIIKKFRDLRGNDSYPYMSASTTVTYETADSIAEFVQRLEELVDKVSVGDTIFDFFDLDAIKLKKKAADRLRIFAKNARQPHGHPVPCPEVFDKLSIHWDGGVSVCCNDHSGVTDLGNVNETPVKEIWRHPTIEAYRERLANKNYDAPLCEVCWDYLSLSEGEK